MAESVGQVGNQITPVISQGLPWTYFLVSRQPLAHGVKMTGRNACRARESWQSIAVGCPLIKQSLSKTVYAVRRQACRFPLSLHSVRSTLADARMSRISRRRTRTAETSGHLPDRTGQRGRSPGHSDRLCSRIACLARTSTGQPQSGVGFVGKLRDCVRHVFCPLQPRR